MRPWLVIESFSGRRRACLVWDTAFGIKNQVASRDYAKKLSFKLAYFPEKTLDKDQR
jgi:hypothetical protein